MIAQQFKPQRMLPVAVIAILLAAFPSCVQFKTQSLYTGEIERPKPKKPDRIDRVVEPVIFAESDRDVWGLEEDECKVASLSTDVRYNDKPSLKIKWNLGADGCTWAGIGIGWEGWAGKDLSAIMDHAGISFYVRTIEGKAFSLPFVLTLEDYSGGMGFCYTANKYFERSAIDEEWQNVIVPLSDFDLETENLDVTNIKQLQIELQQSGAVHVANMELIFHESEPLQPWLEEEKLPDPIDFPITLFDNSFINDNGWGMVKSDCQDFHIADREDSDSKAIHAVWDNTAGDCHLVQFGASWNKWHPVDITPVMESGAIQFEIKLAGEPGADGISVKLGFEDYDRAKTSVKLQSSQISSGDYLMGWATVRVPFESLPETIDFTRIKHFFVSPEGKGEFWMDNIRLVDIEVN
ncbi:MAG: hypothetical protein LC670_11830 [Flavobacteriales bacterium]|nr:hypothetical protein [Flavobacteriales bacterium]